MLLLWFKGNDSYIHFKKEGKYACDSFGTNTLGTRYILRWYTSQHKTTTVLKGCSGRAYMPYYLRITSKYTVCFTHLQVVLRTSVQVTRFNYLMFKCHTGTSLYTKYEIVPITFQIVCNWLLFGDTRIRVIMHITFPKCKTQSIGIATHLNTFLPNRHHSARFCILLFAESTLMIQI